MGHPKHIPQGQAGELGFTSGLLLRGNPHAANMTADHAAKQIMTLLCAVQAIREQMEAGDVTISIWRVVTEAAVVAVQAPARWFIPLVAISNILRTMTLALQIVAESNLPVRMHWVASECPHPQHEHTSTWKHLLATLVLTSVHGQGADFQGFARPCKSEQRRSCL